MSEPIMCTLTPADVQTRREALLPGLASRAERRERTADGYRLVFPASSEVLQAIAAVIDAERTCCRWLRFELIVPPAGGAFVLTLSGPEGTREFLDGLFAA